MTIHITYICVVERRMWRLDLLCVDVVIIDYVKRMDFSQIPRERFTSGGRRVSLEYCKNNFNNKYNTVLLLI